MPINSAYRVNFFSYKFYLLGFVSARIMNSNFKTVKYTADWKEKTDLLFPEKVQKKNRLILKHPKSQNLAEKFSLVKRINED